MPPLDAFGTRLDLGEVREALLGFGVPALHLHVHDDHLALEVGDADVGSDEVSRAITWVRGAFSPLVPVDVRQVPHGLAAGVHVADARTKQPRVVAFSEVVAPPHGLHEALHDLLDRLDVPQGVPCVRSAPPPPAVEGALAPRLAKLAEVWGDCLAERGVPEGQGTLWWFRSDVEGHAKVLTGPKGPGPHLVAWARPGGETGVRPAWILAASLDATALFWLSSALDDPPQEPLPSDILLDGLTWGVARRPTIAVKPEPELPSPIRVDTDRCDDCGVCADLCPVDFLDPHGQPTTDNMSACIRCYDCVDGCPQDALRPVYAADTAMRGDLPSIGEGWLSRLRGAPGPQEPAPFPPSYLLPKPGDAPPRVVLGLAVITQQEHAAALVVDGKLVGAVEEEKLVRVRHYGWKPKSGPRFRNLGVDPTLTVEQVLCRRAIRVLLAEAGLTLDDVDLIAINGLLSRYRHALPVLDADQAVPLMQSGRLVCVPHHLCHAASAYRLSGLDAAWVFTVDGRGDRETAALFRAEGTEIKQLNTVLSLTDRSIGGVYETVTRLLGFGSHGQGSVMALAAFGTPSPALAPYLSASSWSDLTVHEGGIQQVFAPTTRDWGDPIGQEHKDLAASLQWSLEQTLLALVDTGTGGEVDALCLAGGVTLNCRANDLMRRTFRPEAIWAQPGANDAGTAVGAAAEVWARSVGDNLAEMTHPGVGPAFTDDEIEAALQRAGVAYTRVDDVAVSVAELLVDGCVVCWFQGGLEFGPRALGCRSIIADPRREDMQDRVNDIKTREKWRPFGPSVLAGHEPEWFGDAFDSRFMLFTLPVVEEKRSLVPAIVHVDGTSRPQTVHAEAQPLYHRMLSAFHERTGVPIVMNTSFNRRGEPIVCTPANALDAFGELGADVLAIGSFLVRAGERATPAEQVGRSEDAALAALPGGRRLSLRITTECDLSCLHCTMRDHFGHGEAKGPAVTRSLAEGRRAGCDELVIMRGEATIRPDFVRVLKRARRMGYRFIQVQTHGASLANPRLAAKLAGLVDAVEIQLLGHDPETHDHLAGKTGVFRATIDGIGAAMRLGAQVWVTIPVLRGNAQHLPRVIALAKKLGLGRVQLTFPRPVELPDGVANEQLLRLTDAAAAIRRAARYAHKLGLVVSTEGVPMCLLDPSLHGTPDVEEDFSRHRIDDLGLVHDTFDQVREEMRPDAPPCRGCSLRTRCPKTWSLYLEMFGSGELVPVA